MTAAASDRRRAELAAIHTGKRALNLTEDAYRGMLEGLGVTSSADLDAAGRGALLDRMRELGFTRSGSVAPRPAGPATQADKAHALWRDLASAGALRDSSEKGFNAFVHRQTGISRLEWCAPAQLNQVIEGLKAWLGRVSAAKGGDR